MITEAATTTFDIGTLYIVKTAAKKFLGRVTIQFNSINST